MITKILRLTLSRLLGVAAMLVACTAMGQITVNDGSPRGSCTAFTFAGGTLSLSPSGCLGTPPPPPPPIGPVFSFALNNPNGR